MADSSETEEGAGTRSVQANLIAISEGRLRDRFDQDTGHELFLLDGASELLLHVLLNVAKDKATLELRPDREGKLPLRSQDTPALIRNAQVLIGVQALRVTRAARAVLSVGYEVEVQPYARILVELGTHRTAIAKDDTGREAFRWLTLQRSFKERFLDMSARELYENLSRDSHGDPTAVMRLYDAGTSMIEIAPTRTHKTRASLLLHAGFLRDQAVLLSGLSEGRVVLAGLEHLDAGIGEAWIRLREEVPEQSHRP